MRIVIFSDVHGNVVALEALLAAIRRDEAPDALFVAGDLVLLGPRPAEALALLRSIDGARFVKGNTDQYLIDGSPDQEAVAFARARLAGDAIDFVRDLPFEQTLEVAPGHHLHPDGFVCSQCGSQERRSFRRHGWARSVLAVLADPNLDPTRWHEAAVFAALRRALMLLIKNAVVREGSTRSTYCVHLTVTTNPIAEPDSAAVVRMPNTRART